MKKLLLAVLGLSFATCSFATCAFAQESYPNRTIKIVVPLAAGSGTDIMARELAEGLTKRLNQTVIVENRPGANGVTATEYAARQPNDGYTLMMGGNSTHSANPYLFKELKYDPIMDFTPIARLVTASAVLVVSPKGKINTLGDLIAAAKAEPGKLSYGAPNAGSQIAGERIKQLSNVNIARVPYRGLPQAVSDVIGEHIAFTFVDVAAALANVKSGQLRAIVQTASTRSRLMPDVPTLQEAGYPDTDVTYWTGLFAPANIPANVADILSRAVKDVMTEKALIERIDNLGLDPAFMPREKMDEYLRSELAKWRKMIEQAGIEPS